MIGDHFDYLDTVFGPDAEWRLDAACSGTDPEAFFPEKGESVKEAKQICGRCLVRADCLECALEIRDRFGVWGGRSERERRQLLKSLGVEDSAA